MDTKQSWQELLIRYKSAYTHIVQEMDDLQRTNPKISQYINQLRRDGASESLIAEEILGQDRMFNHALNSWQEYFPLDISLVQAGAATGHFHLQAADTGFTFGTVTGDASASQWRFGPTLAATSHKIVDENHWKVSDAKDRILGSIIQYPEDPSEFLIEDIREQIEVSGKLARNQRHWTWTLTAGSGEKFQIASAKRQIKWLSSATPERWNVVVSEEVIHPIFYVFSIMSAFKGTP
eukprot:TRINITY_DN21769_c0_g1_i1.p1 TRINITY_DN21769_c0_g1~~TRINITY_DN21769_c0_g1_i1.p1  ORF type:complete len:243 (-),score=34.14 TRINITY_DN21769_c0_g1_i1:420-1127(-)